MSCDWDMSVIKNCYIGKGDAMVRGNYRGLKMLELPMKLFKRVIEQLIREKTLTLMICNLVLCQAEVPLMPYSGDPNKRSPPLIVFHKICAPPLSLLSTPRLLFFGR